MKKRIKFPLFFMITLLLILSGTSGMVFASEPAGGTVSEQAVRAQLASVQIPFIQNEGRIDDPAVKFYANTFAGTAYVTGGGLTYVLAKDENGETRTCEVRETLVGAKAGNPVGIGSTDTKVNWYSGEDSNKWRTNLPTYNQVNLGEVYGGIELSLKAYGNNVEKVFTVQPGGNPQDIRFTIDGTGSLQANANGELEMGTDLGNLLLTAPVAFQEINGRQVDVAVSYFLQGSGYGFKLGAYNRAYPLVIDPMLAGTFIYPPVQGTGTIPRVPMPIVVTDDYVYIAGTQLNNTYDVAVYKFTKDLKTLLYATTLGGNRADMLYDMKRDPKSGNIFITGRTDSADYMSGGAQYRFPIVDVDGKGLFSMIPNPYDSERKRTEVFVAKLNGDNLATLDSTHFGGGNVDDFGFSIALDSSGNVYVSGLATYTTTLAYPTTSGAFKTTYPVTTSGARSAFITKLSNDLNGGLQADGVTSITDRPMASTFLGGTDSSSSAELAINSQDKIYVGAYTNSSTYLPPSIVTSYDLSMNGTTDTVITKMSNDLTNMEAGTFLGGTGAEVFSDLAVDTSGNVYLTGATVPTGNFPTTAELGPHATTGTNKDIFVSKLNGDLTGLLGSALFGSTNTSNDDTATALALSGNSVYVTGLGALGFPVTQGAFCPATAYSDNIFALKIDQAFTGLLASTLICQGSINTSPSIALDSDGGLYVGGSTIGPSIPVTEGAKDTTHGNPGPALLKITGDLLSYWPAGSVLTVTGKTPTSVDLSWTATDAPSYRILKSGTVIDAVNGMTSYHTTGLIPNTSYTFNIKAGDPALGNWTLDGPSVTVTTDNDLIPPVWPSGSTVSVSGITGSGLTLTWTPATDDTSVSGYKIYRNGAVLASVGGSVLNYTVGELTEDTPYAFKIEAGDGAGNWSSNGPALTYTIDLLAPAWPEGSNLTITNAASDRLTLNWPAATDNIGATNYRIYKDSVLLDTVPATVFNYNVTGLTAETTYTFKVEAGDKAGNWSTDGPGVTARTTENDIAAPTWPSPGTTLTVSDVTAGGLTLIWTPATDNTAVTGYRIYQSSNLLDTVNGDVLNYTISGLTQGTQYMFRIEAGDAAGNWSFDGPSQTVMIDVQAPVWPEGSSLTITNAASDRLTLNWPAATDNVGVTGYRIYRNNTLLGTVPNNMLSYNVAGLDAGTIYTFKVEAGDDSGNWSTDGPSVTTGDILAPAWPFGSALTAVANGGYAVNLSWSEATDNKGVTGYRIYQDGTLLDTVTGTCTSYAVTNLTPGTTYTFKIEAGDAAGNWSTGGPGATIMTPQINISLNLSKQVGAEEDTITASGTANPNTWVTVKVIDSMQDIIFIDATQSDEGGNYSMDFTIPVGVNGPLTVVAGYGNNVATAGLAMAGDPGELAAKIDEATAIFTAAVEGTGYGNYAVGSKVVLQAAIDEAQAVLADAANQTQEQLDAATAALDEVLAAFEAGKVTIAAPKYTVTADSDSSYDNGRTPDGITFMTVKSGVSGLKYFSVSISPVIPHEGNEVVVFVLIRGGVQQTLSATKADFDIVDNAKAGFNVRSGDTVKAYIVDDLTNAVDCNPIILQ